MPEKHEIHKLPLWARAIIDSKDQEIAKLKREKEIIEKMHAILADPQRHWFPLNPNEKDDVMTDLWYFSKNYPLRLCSLSPKDMLFIGRAK